MLLPGTAVHLVPRQPIPPIKRPQERREFVCSYSETPGQERLCQSFRWVELAGAIIGQPCTAHPCTEDAALRAGPGPGPGPVGALGARRAPRRALSRSLLWAPPHGRAAAPPAAVTAAAPPRGFFLLFPSPFPLVFVLFCFSHLLRVPSAAAAPREPRSALGHPRAPPSPASASGHLHKAQPPARLLIPPGSSRRPPAVLPSGRGLPSAREAVRTCPGRTQAAPALRDSAPGSVGQGCAATGR